MASRPPLDPVSDLTRQVAILTAQLDAMSKRLDETVSTSSSCSTYDSLIKPCLKLDVPRFDGTYTQEWISQISQFFTYHQTPEEDRLTIASFYLDGAALAWYQWMYRNNQIASWTQFLEKLEIRFAPTAFVDSRGNLFNLHRTDLPLSSLPPLPKPKPLELSVSTLFLPPLISSTPHNVRDVDFENVDSTVPDSSLHTFSEASPEIIPLATDLFPLVEGWKQTDDLNDEIPYVGEDIGASELYIEPISIDSGQLVTFRSRSKIEPIDQTILLISTKLPLSKPLKPPDPKLRRATVISHGTWDPKRTLFPPTREPPDKFSHNIPWPHKPPNRSYCVVAWPPPLPKPPDWSCPVATAMFTTHNRRCESNSSIVAQKGANIVCRHRLRRPNCKAGNLELAMSYDYVKVFHPFLPNWIVDIGSLWVNDDYYVFQNVRGIHSNISKVAELNTSIPTLLHVTNTRAFSVVAIVVTLTLEFISTMGNNWGRFGHLFCCSMERVSARRLLNSFENNSFDYHAVDCVLQHELRDCGWSTVAVINKLLCVICKQLKEDYDVELVKDYYDPVHSCLIKMFVDLLAEYWCCDFSRMHKQSELFSTWKLSIARKSFSLSNTTTHLQAFHVAALLFSALLENSWNSKYFDACLAVHGDSKDGDFANALERIQRSMFGPNVPISVESKWKGSHMAHTCDFYQSNLDNAYTVVDGRLSHSHYIEALAWLADTCACPFAWLGLLILWSELNALLICNISYHWSHDFELVVNLCVSSLPSNIVNFGDTILFMDMGVESLQWDPGEYSEMYAVLQLSQFKQWDPNGDHLFSHAAMSKVAHLPQIKQWDPGKVVQRQKFYNLEDKVVFDGQGIDTPPNTAADTDPSATAEVPIMQPTAARPRRDKKRPTKYDDHIIYK